MVLSVKLPEIYRIFAILLLSSSLVTGSYDKKFLWSLESFNQKLFYELVHSQGKDNVIYSPFSIQTSLAMLRMGANGNTADELDNALSTTGQTTGSIADGYYSMLRDFEYSDTLKVINKIYVKEGYKLYENYKEYLAKRFFSSAEEVDFSQTEAAAKAINTWVRTKTNNAVSNLVSPGLLGNKVRLLVVSTMYFNGRWATPFPEENTSVQDFYTDSFNTIRVRMMFRKGAFDFGFVRQLNANVVRLPYKDSDLSMLVILPVQRTGLAALEDQLLNFRYRTLISSVLDFRSGLVHLPKFKVEYEIELSHALKKMGMQKMFESADFSNMVNSTESVYVSKVVHRAAIAITEGASDGGGSSDQIGTSLMSPFSLKANHPFAYAIVNENYVPLFQGTFVGF